MADNHRIVPPNIAFSHNHVGLDIKEVSGLVVYKLCFLGVPGGFAGGALEVTRQRQGLHSHLRKRFHPYLFYITFPKVLWLKMLEDPLSTEDTQKSQVTRLSNTPDSGHNWSLQRGVGIGSFFANHADSLPDLATEIKLVMHNAKVRKKSLYLCDDSSSYLVRTDFP